MSNSQEVYTNEDGRFEVWPRLELEGDEFKWHRVEVFIPKGVDEKTLDVVYMNDGESAFRPGLSGFSWDAHKTVASYLAEDRIRPMMVVAVHPRKREYEYLHVKEFSGKGHTGGGLPRYATYLTNLKQHIDRSYPTNPDAKRSTLVGSSHGGLASFFTGCIHSGVFGNVAAMSPSLWAGGVFNLRKTSLMHLVGESLRKEFTQNPRIWLDWGLKRRAGLHNLIIELLATRWGRKLGRILQDDYGYVSGKDLFIHEDRIGGHDEQAWAYRFGLMIETFFGRG